ncbi:MAG TPA: peptidoglycan DD-metalloendopeptidase family protein [Anaerolineaceae bacterium]|nr:peptidoglycan DD-metalloendopeptidase family protein [Anaerolineaceae bacterium]
MRSSIARSIILLSLMLLLALFAAGCAVLPEEGEPEEGQLPLPKALSSAVEIELSNQIQQEAAARQDVLAFIVYRVSIDSVDFSEDGSLALAWLALVDKETGFVQPAEPGLVIAHKTGDPAMPWRLVFQADANFAEELMALPEDLLSAENRQVYLPGVQKEQKAGTVYTGYRLPWPKGQKVRVSGSVGHVFTYKSCPADCLYAFDFANGSMFDVVAARQGTVKYVVWKYENGNTKNANYIVLEDTTTNPTTYQVYLHLAQNSIPPELRQVGARVVQGQFLGKADDTGYSTGHHLHFHVHTDPDYYWGKSVDIVFEDVPINGGRPRTCAEAAAFPQYGKECAPGNFLVSNNGDSAPPTGAITSPEAGAGINAPTLNISGWMTDDIGVLKGQLIYKTFASWSPLGPELLESNFNTSVDLCALRVPNGKFSLGLVVTDKAGNISKPQGVMDVVKKYDCPPLPPVCTPAADEVALHNDTEYQGSCQLLKMGEYADLAGLEQVKGDQALSIQVGAGVSAMVYGEPNFAGTMELFQDGDDNLANNLIGAANASSIKIVKRIVMPTPATLNLPQIITDETFLAVTWTVEEGTESRARLTGPKGFVRTVDWQTTGAWQVGMLPAGNYKVSVEARNLLGSATTTQQFSVVKAVEPPSTRMDALPQTYGSTAIKLGWVVESHADEVERFELQVREGQGDWVDYQQAIGSAARSLVFWADQNQVYEFRMRAVNKLGTAEAYPDNAETFTLVLSDCLGDDAERAGDNQRELAPLVSSNAPVRHNWCPAGDADWVRFDAKAGDSFVLRANPQGPASGAVVQLFAAGSEVLLGEARPFNVDGRTTLSWMAPADGSYAVKLSPVDARIAGVEAEYTFSVEKKGAVKPLWFVLFSAMVSALMGGGYAAARRVKKTMKQKKSRVGW